MNNTFEDDLIHHYPFFEFQINNHDKVHDEQGVFTYKDRWLLVLENPEDLSSLQQFAGNIIHLTATVQKSKKKVRK